MGIYWNKDAKTDRDDTPQPRTRPKAKPRPGPSDYRGRTWTSPPGTEDTEGEPGEAPETPSRKR